MDINRILIEADLLFDIDIGIIKFIRDKFADPNFFNIDILELPDIVILGLLQERENKNPLYILSLDNSECDYDNLYEEFMNTYKKDILEYSELSSVYDFVVACYGDSDVHADIDIVVDNNIDYSFVKKELEEDLNKNINIIKKSDILIDLTDYDSVYLKYSDNIIHYKNIDGKNIYIADLYINLDPLMYEEKIKIPKMNVLVEIAQNNEIRVFTMYDYDESYYPVG